MFATLFFLELSISVSVNNWTTVTVYNLAVVYHWHIGDMDSVADAVYLLSFSAVVVLLDSVLLTYDKEDGIVIRFISLFICWQDIWKNYTVSKGILWVVCFWYLEDRINFFRSDWIVMQIMVVDGDHWNHWITVFGLAFPLLGYLHCCFLLVY